MIDEILHILDRFQLHIWLDAAWYLMACALFAWLDRRNLLPRRWKGWIRLAGPALTSFFATMLIEPIHMHHGQWVVKTYADYVSHILGHSLWTWVQYRVTPYFAKALLEIRR